MIPDKTLVRRKMANLIKYLQELASLPAYTLEQYLDNTIVRRAIERLLQIVVETAADINGYLSIGAGEKPPTSYYDSFLVLEHKRIITADLAQKLAPTTGLRNRLVHEYDAIDDSIIYSSISRLLCLYRDYITQIESYLESDNNQ